MPTVRGDVAPIPAHGRVVVQLWGTDQPVTGFVGATQITGEYQTATLADGSWSIVLDAGNSEITPANTVYRIVYLNGTITFSTFYVIVPAGGGSYDVDDILSSPPGSIDPPGLAAHIASLTAHPAANITFAPTGTIAATNVQAAIAEAASEAGTVEHIQSSSAASWVVNHNLGRHPAAVSVLDASNQLMVADVIHGSVNQTTVVHASPTTGKVVVS